MAEKVSNREECKEDMKNIRDFPLQVVVAINFIINHAKHYLAVSYNSLQ